MAEIEASALYDAYPLPEGWATPEHVRESLQLEGLNIRAEGFFVEAPTGEVIAGSAAGITNDPRKRAYFELLERAAIVVALSEAAPTFPCFDAQGQCSQLSRSAVFPTSSDPSSWRYARSNGVAAHSALDAACSSAALELVERDRLLRSWYGELRPVRLERLPSPLLALARLYDCGLYAFPAASPREPKVIGVVGFPYSAEHPLLCGWGAALEEETAIARAVAETIQRLAFLWGETIVDDLPNFSPSAEYHQDFFLRPSTHGHIRAWLAGAHQGSAALSGTPSWATPRFVDLTARHLKPRMHVVKAIAEACLPLSFGREYPFLKRVPADLQVHPLS